MIDLLHLLTDPGKRGNYTCYMEFIPGRFKGKYWNKNAVFIHEDVFHYFLTPISRRWKFDPWDNNEIPVSLWRGIIADYEKLLCQAQSAATSEELKGSDLFYNETAIKEFGIDFDSNKRAYCETLSGLLSWLKQEMDRNDVISILGI